MEEKHWKLFRHSTSGLVFHSFKEIPQIILEHCLCSRCMSRMVTLHLVDSASCLFSCFRKSRKYRELEIYPLQYVKHNKVVEDLSAVVAYST